MPPPSISAWRTLLSWQVSELFNFFLKGQRPHVPWHFKTWGRMQPFHFFCFTWKMGVFAMLGRGPDACPGKSLLTDAVADDGQLVSSWNLLLFEGLLGVVRLSVPGVCVADRWSRCTRKGLGLTPGILLITVYLWGSLNSTSPHWQNGDSNTSLAALL